MIMRVRSATVVNNSKICLSLSKKKKKEKRKKKKHDQ